MIRVEIKFKNATLMNALEKSQYKSIAELSRISGISYHCLIELASLKRIPRDVKVQLKLAELLNCDLYDLFEQYEELVQKSEGKPIRISKDIPIDKMLSLSSNEMLQIESDYDIVDIDDEISLKKEIEDVIETLKEREADIIKMHFGLGNVSKSSQKVLNKNADSVSSPLALSEIAKIFGITKERTRQIKEKALRRLRHRSISRKLRPFAKISPKEVEKNLQQHRYCSSYDYSKKHSRELERDKIEHDKKTTKGELI